MRRSMRGSELTSIHYMIEFVFARAFTRSHNGYPLISRHAFYIIIASRRSLKICLIDDIVKYAS